MNDELREKLNRLVDKCHDGYNDYHNIEQAVKKIINSSYGCFGTNTFLLYNKIIAESITTTGKYMTLTLKGAIAKYCREQFHDDTELHDRMGIKVVNNNAPQDCTVYAQTDSVYTSFYDVCCMTNFMGYNVWASEKFLEKGKHYYVSQYKYKDKESAAEALGCDVDDIIEKEPSGLIFCQMMYEYRMKDFYEQKLEEVAAEYHVDNIESFELESYADAGIWLGKNRYIQNIRWTDPDVYYEPFKKLKATGVELADQKTPKWCKDQLKEFLVWLMSTNNVCQKSINDKIDSMKKAFKTKSVEEISWIISVNVYDNYVLDDKKEIKLKPKSSASTAGAALFNYLLVKNKMTDRFSKIKSGDKVAFFYAKPVNGVMIKKGQTDKNKDNKNFDKLFDDEDDENGKFEDVDVTKLIFVPSQVETFAYPVGIDRNYFPQVKVDYNMQFEKVMLNAINRFITAIGYKPYEIHEISKFNFFD